MVYDELEAAELCAGVAGAGGGDPLGMNPGASTGSPLKAGRGSLVVRWEGI